MAGGLNAITMPSGDDLSGKGLGAQGWILAFIEWLECDEDRRGTCAVDSSGNQIQPAEKCDIFHRGMREQELFRLSGEHIGPLK